MGYVYFLKHKGLSPIKIGMTNSNDVNTRINDYKTASPYGIELIGIIKTPHPSVIERNIHEELNQFRLNGEWFDISLETANKIILKNKVNSDPIPLNNDKYRANDELAEILLSMGFGDFTDEIDKNKGKRVFSINETGRYLKFDYINIAIFDDLGRNIFYGYIIKKAKLSDMIDYLTYKS